MDTHSRNNDPPAAHAKCALEKLDPLSVSRYEDIALLAATICETPIAFIGVFDSGRLWFKAKLGFDMPCMQSDDIFLGHAIKEVSPLVVPDTQAEGRCEHTPWLSSGLRIRLYACVPLISGQDKLIGALGVMDLRPRMLNEAQKNSLCVLARHSVTQLESDKRLAALRESELRFKTFMDNSPALAWLKDAEGRYVYVNQPYLKRCGLPQSAILGRTDFEIWPHSAAYQIRRNEEECMAEGKLHNDLETYAMPDGQVSYWQVSRFLLDGASSRLLGGMALDVTDSKRSEQQLMQYQQELQLTLQKLEMLSVTDGLTGLYNRRAFDEKLKEEFERACRYRLPLSLLLVDVDNFKKINDAMGHTEGDELLCSIAAMLKENARANDVTARYGGDEFVVILPNTNSKVAFHLAERLRASIRTLGMVPFQATLSIGVSALTPNMKDRQELIVAADKAMYEAKRRGRNRVCNAD